MSVARRPDIFPIPEQPRDIPRIVDALGTAALKIGETIFDTLPKALKNLHATSSLVVEVNQEVADYRASRT